MQDDKAALAQAKALMRAEDYEGALALLDRLVFKRTQSVALHWYRSRCLVKLGRLDKARSALDAVLRRRPNFVPALMVRIKLARDAAEDLDIEPLLRRVLVVEPERSRAMYWLADTLLNRDDGSEKEAAQLLERAIALNPALLKARLRRAALLIANSRATADTPHTVIDAHGHRHDRDKLEAALADFQYVATQRDHDRADLRAANTLIRLGRPQEAIAHFDRVLARLPKDSAKHASVQDMRHRALASAAAAPAHHHPAGTVADPGSAAASRNASRSTTPSQGTSNRDMAEDDADAEAGYESRLSEFHHGETDAPSPEDAFAIRIANDIYLTAYAPAPRLQWAQAAAFPSDQRRHADACNRVLSRLGFDCLGDAQTLTDDEAIPPQLMRIFVHPAMGTMVAYTAQRPLATGLQRLIRMPTLPWHAHGRLEGLAMLSNQVFIGSRMSARPPLHDSTQTSRTITLPVSTSVSKLVQSHNKHLKSVWAEFPGTQLVVPRQLEGLEQQWLRSIQARQAGRRTIGYVSDDELRRLLGKRYDQMQGRVRLHLRRLIEQTDTASSAQTA